MPDLIDDVEDGEVLAKPPRGKKLHPWGVFTDYEQAMQHIGGRMVIFEKEAWLVSSVAIDGRANLVDPWTREMRQPEGRIPVDDPGFNGFKFDSFGWVNLNQGAMLVELLPIRQTRRGYGDENLRISGFDGMRGAYLDRAGDVEVLQVMRQPGFGEMLREEYPPFTDASVEVHNHDRLSIAVSKALSVQSDVDGYAWLWRYADRIASMPDLSVIQLGKRWSFLKEELQECASIPEGVWIK
jgi:hypothetical protein